MRIVLRSSTSRPGRFAFVAAAGLLVATVASPALSYRGAGDTMELRLADGATSVPPLRPWGPPPASRRAAWERFTRELGAGARAQWDERVGVPSRILGLDASFAGSVAGAATAERAARGILARHLSLLAPGSAEGDFILAHNTVHDGLRSVVLSQHHGGFEVRGARVEVRFQADRLVLVASTARPHLHVDTTAPRFPRSAAIEEALSLVTRGVGALGPAAKSTALREVHDPVIVDLADDRGRRRSHLAYEIVLDTRGPRDRIAVLIDAVSGEPIGRQRTLRFETAALEMMAPRRYPAAGFIPYSASHLDVQIDGVTASADADGLVAFPGPGPVSLVATAPKGAYVNVVDFAGPSVGLSTALAADSAVAWSGSTEAERAQLSAYAHASRARAWAKRTVGDLPWLDGALTVNVGVDGECNAYADEDSLNFFPSSADCENSALLTDVVIHEYGHLLHSALDLTGLPDVALSEGFADYAAATNSGDPGTGRGFFYTDAPLRDIDPEGEERVWPVDVQVDPHETGRIISGAMWDLRKAISEKSGPSAGAAITDRLFASAIRGASDIPTMYAETLVADDDDGDLGNGTPHACEIAAAFETHGLRGRIDADLDAPAIVPADQEGGYPIALLLATFPKCESEALTGATLTWERTNGDEATFDVPLDIEDGNRVHGVIPSQPAGTALRYTVKATLAGGRELRFPANPGDPWVAMYVGEVVPLYCTGFESDPWLDGWTHELVKGLEGGDEWQWGPPEGPRAGDPESAHQGTSILGTDLTGDGLYSDATTTRATSPTVDTQGFTEVRLQYYRWLRAEDGLFDQATIRAGESVVWHNTAGDGSAPHEDGAWRFHDVDLSAGVADSKVQISFELASDGGGRRGGFSIDDLCIVGISPPPCTGDACGGDGGGGAGGGGTGGAGGSPHTPDDTPPDGCACSSTGGEAGAPWWLAACLALVAWRRPRRR